MRRSIDKWNKEGLINSKVDDSAAKNLWATKKVAYWVTGPWNVDLARQTATGSSLKIVQLPAIKCQSVPFLGVQGFMVTKYAATHGVETAAKDLVGNYMLGTAAQSALAAGNGRYPANVLAGKQVSGQVPVRARDRLQGRHPDAEHPPDGLRVVGARDGVGQGDQGQWLDEGLEGLHRGRPQHRQQDRLVP